MKIYEAVSITKTEASYVGILPNLFMKRVGAIRTLFLFT